MIKFAGYGKIIAVIKMSDKIIYLDEVDSTNVYADRLCRSGGEIPLAVVADFQTKGSGRMGRSFHSPKGTGIYMTYILDTENVETLNLITTSAGLAVAEVLAKYCSLDSSIKWPNDILLSSGKVCGILTRLITEKGKIKFALIGIGINVSGKKRDFPEEIKDIATTLEEETETIFDKKILTEKIIENLNEIFINKKYTEKQIVENVKKRSAMLGKNVFVKSENREFFAVDISSDGGLVVRDGKETKVIHSGEVEFS